jgi:hypothetical protein
MFLYMLFLVCAYKYYSSIFFLDYYLKLTNNLAEI